MKSYVARPGDVKQDWFVVDATGKTLGRMAARLATVLRGKHKAQFTPHLDCGDFVVVINAEKVRLTGKKLTDKVYTTHSGYPGGLKQVEARRLLQERPERVIETAVRGMLPKNYLGRKMATKLHVYKGPDHPHSAQQPRVLDLDRLRAADAE